MKALLGRFEQVMSAITFAEAGEFDTARRIMGYPDGAQAHELCWAERMAAAVAMAEGGLHEDALRIAGGQSDGNAPLSAFLQNVGLSGAHVRYALIRVEIPVVS